MILIDPISPVALSIGPLEIRWYALAYIAAFLVGVWLIKKLDTTQPKKYWDDLLTWIILGIIAGGRLGYVLFYNAGYYLQHPIEIFFIWQGGMAFHGGMLGAMAAAFLYARKNPFVITEQRHTSSLRVAIATKQSNKKFMRDCRNGFNWIASSFAALTPRNDVLYILDRIATVAPIGLFFGRIANFINMEVMGRVTMQPWGIVFRDSNYLVPRHATPLYHAALEGLLLFIIMMCLWRFTNLKNRPGALTGAAMIGYGVFRIFVEQFREPDSQLGFLLGTDWLTMGMVLSGVMVGAGIILMLQLSADGKSNLA